MMYLENLCTIHINCFNTCSNEICVFATAPCHIKVSAALLLSVQIYHNALFMRNVSQFCGRTLSLSDLSGLEMPLCNLQ